MKTLLAASAVVFAAGSASADNIDIYDHIETATPYSGTAFEADVDCMANAVQAYLGEGSDVRSELGLIFGQKGNLNAFVALTGERAESNLATVTWIELSSNDTQSHVNFEGIDGPFYTAGQNQGHEITASNDSRYLEEMLRNCGQPAAPAA